jgi:hypothetical protein
MKEEDIYAIIIYTASSFSMLGCTFVIGVYLLLPEVRVFSFKLIVYLCIASFGHSLGNS